jgi:heptosyltransferase-3
LSEVLGRSKFADGYLAYPIGMRNWPAILRLAQEIRHWHPDVLVYMAEPRNLLSTMRDLLFFRLCGIRRIVGAPLSKELRVNLPTGEGFLEYEASRLARNLAPLGDARLDDPRSWNLYLELDEIAKAEAITTPMINRGGFIACCSGTKMSVKDWGERKWTEVLSKLSGIVGGLELAMVGSAEEFPAATRIVAQWRGRSINLCGKLTPRETAAVLKKARLFVGHDSGPMHLAAAMGTPCVAIFSARNIPKVWFPYGEHHHVIYHRTPCAGCGLEECVRFGKRCIDSITVDEVSSAVTGLLDR